MTIWDDRILEYLRESGGASVGELEDSKTIQISNAQVSRRCKKLAEKGLIRPLGNGVYTITPRGEGYLEGEISTFEGEPDEINNSADDENSESGAASPSSPG